jgi:chemotaxis protein MotB
MKTLMSSILTLLFALGPLHGAFAQTQDIEPVRHGEGAFAYAQGAIQKVTPRDGIVNLITGDNQTTGNRMLNGKGDVFYLKLDNPTDVAVGDLYTVYRRVRKSFHPVTKDYLGFITIRVAVVRVIDTDPQLATVQSIINYGQVAPGDPVMKYVAPPLSENVNLTADVADISGMIIELQADKTMTLVSQYDAVYLDRGKEDGLKPGDLMDITRRSAGLPVRKIGQVKVVSTEDRTATGHITKANTRIMKGDRVKLVGYQPVVAQPVEVTPPPKVEPVVSVPSGLVATKLKVQDASGQSRINLAEMANLLHYESGEASIKPDSYKVLDQLIEYLNGGTDTRLIRVEGHTDNVEIGPTLKSRYPSNWELSKARANGVIRYLVEKGGVDSARLQSVGYGDSRPAATNAVEEGRTKNRRVEILLYEPGTEPQASKSDMPSRMRKQDGEPSAVSVSRSGAQSIGASDDAKTPASGTLSTGGSSDSSSPSPSPIPDSSTSGGTGASKPSDTGSDVNSGAGKQDPAQQPGPATF